MLTGSTPISFGYPWNIRKKEPDIQKVIPWMSKGYPDVAFKNIWTRISIEHPDWVCLRYNFGKFSKN